MTGVTGVTVDCIKKSGGQNDKKQVNGACLVIRLVGCTGLVCGKSEEGLSVSGKENENG